MKRRDVLKTGLAVAGASLLPAMAFARAPTTLVLSGEGTGCINGHYPARIIRHCFMADVRMIEEPQAALDLAAQRVSLVIVDVAHIGFPEEARKVLAWKRQLRALDPDVPLLFIHGFARGEYPAALFEGARELTIPFHIRDLIAECAAFGIKPLPRHLWGRYDPETPYWADHGNS